MFDFEAARTFQRQHEEDCPVRGLNLGERLKLSAMQAVDDPNSITLPGGCCALRASYEMV